MTCRPPVASASNTSVRGVVVDLWTRRNEQLAEVCFHVPAAEPNTPLGPYSRIPQSDSTITPPQLSGPRMSRHDVGRRLDTNLRPGPYSHASAQQRVMAQTMATAAVTHHGPRSIVASACTPRDAATLRCGQSIATTRRWRALSMEGFRDTTWYLWSAKQREHTAWDPDKRQRQNICSDLQHRHEHASLEVLRVCPCQHTHVEHLCRSLWLR